MANHDVPDSTDWLSTPLPGLAAVESALRCEVCKDFYKTPMMTSCFHTFCSLCIRRALSNDGKCPLCRATDQQPRLRSNWAMEETVEAFVKARTATLDLARSRNEASSVPKRKAKDKSDETNDAPEGKRLRTSARLKNHRTDYTNYVDPEEQPEVVEVPDENDDGLVPCPLCQSRMKEGEVWDHVSVCTGAASPKPKRKPSTPAFSQLQAHQAKPLERLPGLNYSMMKDVALRKKMTDLGISNQGSRKLLERRHKEWITIWNANCDSVRPRKRHELQHDLNTWERTQGGRAPAMAAVQSEPMVKDKEFDGAAWAAKHDSSFQDLIAMAKQSRMEAKRKAEEAKKEAAEEASRAEEADPTIPMTPPEPPTILDQTPSAIPTGPSPYVPPTSQSYHAQLPPTTTSTQDPSPALQTLHSSSMPTTSGANAHKGYVDGGAVPQQPPTSWSGQGSRDYPELPWQTASRPDVPLAIYPYEQPGRNDRHVQHAPRPSQEGVPSHCPGALAGPPQGGP